MGSSIVIKSPADERRIFSKRSSNTNLLPLGAGKAMNMTRTLSGSCGNGLTVR